MKKTFPHPRIFLVLAGISLLLSNQFYAQDILWEKSYGGIQSEYLFDAQPTADYGFILAGSSLSGKSGNKKQENIKDLDYWVWKMDEKGDMDWQKNLGGTGADYLQSIKGTLDGGFILGGTSTSPKGADKKDDNFGKEDLWIIKLNAKGDEEWQKTIGGTGRDVMKEIHQTRDGGYIIGGSSESIVSGLKTELSYGSLDYWIIKLDATGNIEWQKTFGGKFMDQLESIISTKDDGYLIGGWSNSFKSGNKSEDVYGEGDYWVLKLDRDGTIEWQRALGGEQDDHLYTIIELKEGGYLAGGNSSSSTSGNKKKSNGRGTDFWLVKLSEVGEIDWQETYDFGKTDMLISITENGDGTLLLGGHAKTENTGLERADKKGIDDFIALKIAPDGEEKWRKTVGSAGEDNLKKLIETRDGGYLLAGTTNGKVSRDRNSGQGRRDFWVVKLRDKDKEDEEGRYVGLEAFPNPTENFTNVIVNHEFENGNASVYDISGKQVQFFAIESRTVPIDLQGLPVGVYIVTVKTNVSTESVKILKSN
jgi:hypothetical protein